MNYSLKHILSHMDVAIRYSQLSYCQRLKVGAVAVKDQSIIAHGYNGTPSGEPNVCELDDGTTSPDVRHAEANVLKKITRSTNSSVGSSLFVTHSCCKQCAIDIVDAGIVEVYYKNEYRDLSGIEYLKRKGVRVYRVNHEEVFEV